MKNLLIIITILSLLIANINYANNGDGNKTPSEKSTQKKGEKFADKKGNFRIKFPGEPTTEKKTIESEIGDIQMFTFMYTGSVEVYMVAYSDYPEDKISGVPRKDMVQSAKTGFLGNLALNIIDEKEFKMNNNYGVYVEAKNEKYYTVAKLFMVDNRLYQLAILVTGDNIAKKTASDFLDSFELIKK